MDKLNGLLVTRQVDNTSPGVAPGGKSVPGSFEIGLTFSEAFSCNSELDQTICGDTL